MSVEHSDCDTVSSGRVACTQSSLDRADTCTTGCHVPLIVTQ